MIFKSLFKPAPKKPAVSEDKLPVLHSFVDVTIPGRAARSVPIESVSASQIVVRDVPGRVGDRASFVYETSAGRFRCGATLVAIREGMSVFGTPSRVESIGGGSQKRSSVRMDVLVSGGYRLAPGGKPVGDFQRASIRDISRGGCSLIIDRQCKLGQMLEVRLNLRSGAVPLEVLAEVMRSEQIPTSGKFSHGLRFHGMRPHEDQAILEFINNKTTELRNRGLA